MRNAIRAAVTFGLALTLFPGGPAALAQETQPEPKLRYDKGVVYAKPHGEELKLDVYLPADVPDAKTVPGVLVVHGGAWRTGTRRQLAYYATTLARRGYAAFAIDYRLAPEHKFPAQIEDCRSAVRWIRAHAEKYGVDPQRLGAVGYSAGGHLVALLACTASEKKYEDTRLQAVVAGGAPCDFRGVPRDSKTLTFWLGGTRAEVPERYQAASPAAFVSADAPPMFFFNGERDRLVEVESAREMVEALRDVEVEAEMYVVAGAGHIAAAINPEALRRSWKFLDEHLKDRDDHAEE